MRAITAFVIYLTMSVALVAAAMVAIEIPRM